jgi:guanylate kinase
MMPHASHYGLIVVSAPSGTGKSTLCTRLLAELQNEVALSISTTSRKPRGQEVHGKEYFFVTAEAFKEKIAEGAFAEWALVHGNYYGTETKNLEIFWNQKKNVLLDIDVQGADSFKLVYPEKTFSIFLAPPSMEELERRLRGRGTETEEAIVKRMANAVQELGRKDDFDLVIVNDDLEQTYFQLKQAVNGFMKDLERGTWQKRP